MKKIIFILFVWVIFIPFTSYASDTEGRLRIISLSPSATEILFALGLGDEIIGVTTFCNYPKEALAKERIGSYLEPNLEKIISLKPNLIISLGNMRQDEIKKLKELGFNVYIYDPRNVDELLKVIENMGNLTKKNTGAQIIIDSINEKIKNIRQKVSRISTEERPKVYIEISPTPLISLGRESFIDEMITLAGGRNIFHDLKRSYFTISPEVIVIKNPDVIILGYMIQKGAKENIKKRIGWKNINAIKNNRIYDDIDQNLFLRLGPRVADGITMIYQRIYSYQDCSP